MCVTRTYCVCVSLLAGISKWGCVVILGIFFKLLQLVCQFFAMPDLKEQRVSMRFCFLFGKMAVTVVMLKTLTRKMLWGKQKFTSGFLISKIVK